MNCGSDVFHLAFTSSNCTRCVSLAISNSYLGEEKGHTSQMMHAQCDCMFYYLLIITPASLFDILYFNLIYFLVFQIDLHIIAYLIAQCPFFFPTSSKWQQQHMMLQLLYAVNAKKNTPLKMSLG